MLVLMKLISLSIDMHQNRIVNLRFSDFIGYILSFDSIIFGPWISFSDFLSSMDQRKRSLVKNFNL
jgi:D-alanyl-lipoteichoic acid acyltransferase DltB (MBOAT superfamily)